MERVAARREKWGSQKRLTINNYIVTNQETNELMRPVFKNKQARERQRERE